MAVREVVRIRGVNQHWDLDCPEGGGAGELFGQLVAAFDAGKALKFVSPDGGRRRVVINPRDITYLELERVEVAETAPVVVEIPGDTPTPKLALMPPTEAEEPAPAVPVESEPEPEPGPVASTPDAPSTPVA